jgi:N-carbamoyl-L-amino-acid hydrolase
MKTKMPVTPIGDDKGPFEVHAEARQLFAALAEATADPVVGITREAFGPGEQKALDIFKSFSEDHDLNAAVDACGNLVVSLAGKNPAEPCIICGSHLDSVPRGGNYDGAAGVVAGLVCLAAMKADRQIPHRTIKVYGLRCEESAWFGKSYVGSSALFGQLGRDDLESMHRNRNTTLADALKSIGADIDAIRQGKVLLDPRQAAMYLELHIEQGPVLLDRGLSTAIVTGIRGAIRHKQVICRGQAGHSGAVPRWLRRDALFAVSELICNLDEHWRVLMERGLDLVVTFGIIGTNPADHAMTRIPGEVAFCFEVRSQSIEALEAFYHLMMTECRRLEADRRVAFEFDRRLFSAPALMNERVIAYLKKASLRLGLTDETIPSGAGHDAAVFANAGIPTGMIFVRNQKGSHNPQESMNMDDFVNGVALLHQILMEEPGR